MKIEVDQEKILFNLHEVMSQLVVGLESCLGLENLRATEINYLNRKVHLMKIARSCNGTFRS